MNEDKQIEEMYKDVYEAINHNRVIDVTHDGFIDVNTIGLTRELYDDGYRKASEVAEDIIRMLRAAGINEWRYPIVADIKKKYMEGCDG